MGSFLGADRDLIAGTNSNFCWSFSFSLSFSKKRAENLYLAVVPAIANRDRPGVVELVGRDRLLFARVEIRVTKKLPKTPRISFGLKFCRSNSNPPPRNFIFLAAEELCM